MLPLSRCYILTVSSPTITCSKPSPVSTVSATTSKDRGFVVDYVGVGNDLKKALDSYAEREQQEIIEAMNSK